MQATLDERYAVEVIEPQLIQGETILKYAYDRQQYPDLQEWFKKRFWSHKPFLYQDELQSCMVIEVNYSWMSCSYIDEKEIDWDNLFFPSDIYGDLGKMVEPVKEVEYMKRFAYGTITLKPYEPEGDA